MTYSFINYKKEQIILGDGAFEHISEAPYAVMAAFVLSRQAVLDKNYPEAIKQLNWVKDHSKNNSIQEIARIRIARILIANKQYDAALAALNTIDDNTYIGMIDEVRGDAYFAKQDIASAQKYYQLAIKEIPNADISRPILQMKLANIASTIPSVS